MSGFAGNRAAIAAAKEDEVMTQAERPAKKGGWTRFLPLFAIAAGMVAFFALGLDRYITFDTLKDNREALLALVADNPVLSALAFMGVYAAAVALSLPGGAVMSIAGGFLFGWLLGTVYVVIGATLGATAVFLAAKTSIGDALRRKAGPWLARLESGFRSDAFNYLLFLRLVPAFPFFAVNLVPAFLGVGLRTYVAATAIGIVPGTFVFAFTGAGLGSVFDRGEAFSLSSVVTPEILIALVGLGCLALLPVAVKKLRARKTG